MRAVSIKGVLVGGITDILSSFILGIPIAIYAISQIDRTHIPKDQINSAVAATTRGNIPLYLVELFIGMCCSVLGGYVAAWLAKHDELLNGGLSAFLCISIGVYSIASGKDSHTMHTQVLLLVASPCLGLLGGYLRLRQRPTASAIV